MTGRDLAEWEAFERVFGPIVIHERIDIAQAILSSVTARSHGVKGDTSPEHYLPRWDQVKTPTQGQSADELVQVLRGMAKKGKGKPSHQ